MKKLFKLLISLIAVAVLFVAAVTVIFLVTFDANQYKQDLSDLVREETGRDLQFHGDVSLTLYPALGMKLGALSLSNAPGFGAQPMLKVNAASISVDVASLIAFEPVVEQLLLDRLEVNLQKNAQGVTNWDDLVKAESATTDADAGNAPTTGSAANDTTKTDIRGAFGGLKVANARMTWRDAQAGTELKIQDLDITTGRITPDAPFLLQLHLALETSDDMAAIVDLSSQVHYVITDSTLRLGTFSLDIDATGASLPQGKIKLGVSGDSIQLNPAQRSIDVQGLGLGVNDSLLRGNVTVTDYAQPAIRFKLDSDLLDVDALLGTPPVSAQPVTAEPTTETAKSAEDVAILLPMELLRALKLEGQVTARKIKVQNLWLDDVDLTVTASNGIVNLNPMKMNLYEGRFIGQVQLDAKAEQPVFRISQELRDVKVGLLLTDFLGEKRISGDLTASVELTTGGEWLSELKRQSQGSMQLVFADGALAGFNLRQAIDSAKARLRREPVPANTSLKTDFSALSISGVIKNGVFSSNDLNLQAPLIRVGGEGKANLNNNTVDYLVRAKLVGTVEAQSTGGVDDLDGLLIPVRIVGPFAGPEVDVQLDDMLKDQAARRLAEEKAKLKADIERQKAELEQQIAAEKARLEAAKQREIEKQKAVLEARKKAEEEALKKKLEDKLKNQLEKLF